MALAAHDEVLLTAIEAHGGFMFKHTGDGVCAAFVSPKSVLQTNAVRQFIQCHIARNPDPVVTVGNRTTRPASFPA